MVIGPFKGLLYSRHSIYTFVDCPVHLREYKNQQTELNLKKRTSKLANILKILQLDNYCSLELHRICCKRPNSQSLTGERSRQCLRVFVPARQLVQLGRPVRQPDSIAGFIPRQGLTIRLQDNCHAPCCVQVKVEREWLVSRGKEKGGGEALGKKNTVSNVVFTREFIQASFSTF